MKSLERVTLKSRTSAQSDGAPKTFAWSDDSSSDDEGSLGETPDQTPTAGGNDRDVRLPSSPSNRSLLSDGMPYVQGLLFAPSVTQAEDHAAPLDAPWGRSDETSGVSPSGFAMHGRSSGSGDDWNAFGGRQP